MITSVPVINFVVIFSLDSAVGWHKEVIRVPEVACGGKLATPNLVVSGLQ